MNTYSLIVQKVNFKINFLDLFNFEINLAFFLNFNQISLFMSLKPCFFFEKQKDITFRKLSAN